MDEYNGLPQQPEELSAVPEEEDEEEQAPRRPGAELYEWLQMFLGCVVAAVVLFNCVARLTRVDGSSMDTTLQHGEIMLIWSLGYTPKQGDIVVLNKTSVLLPDWTEPRAIVKRVIATGGQTVDVDYSTGAVYVDGRPLDEPYLHEEMRRPGAPSMQETHWEVPEGSIFVMGDNRNYSTDSRDSLLGAIDTDYILGKAILALWPLNRFGAV
jgi:signal peptidase I